MSTLHSNLIPTRYCSWDIVYNVFVADGGALSLPVVREQDPSDYEGELPIQQNSEFEDKRGVVF